VHHFNRRAFKLLILAGTFAVTAAAAPGGASAASHRPKPKPTPFSEGIDASHWQGTISWSRVATAGKKFVFLKASEGRTYVDPTFSSNRTGARAAGIVTGAYHFARPDSTAGDALAEAHAFLAAATFVSNDLRPVLDIEVNGGLGVSALTSWVRTWLDEVYRLTGRRAIIYTGPSFWRNSLGDTQSIAQAGYTTLWIAHWNVTTPTVPAGNWAGYGWSFWQYSSCGSVSGISGCVDLDRANGTDLTPYLFG
jgi:GH25 family lysozyme M1 (1,4-beta-N-acetylmuramidase)